MKWQQQFWGRKKKTVLGTTQEFSSSHNLTQNHRGRSTENWLEDQTVFCKNFPAQLFASKWLFSWGDINRVYSQKSDLDAKEFCKLSLFYYLTWWCTELKSTMTKENTHLYITPGKKARNELSNWLLKCIQSSNTEIIPWSWNRPSTSCTPSRILGLREGVTALALSAFSQGRTN